MQKDYGADDLEGNVEYDESIPLGHSESEDSEGELQAVPNVEGDDQDPNAIFNPHTSTQVKSEASTAKKRAKLQTLRAKKKQRTQGRELRFLSSEEQCQRLWALYVSAHTAAGFKLTDVEAEDGKAAFIPSRLAQLPHTRTVEQLPTHLKTIWPDWKTSASDEPGCPRILILTYSAPRAVLFTKALRGVRKDLHVAKLFSRHMKVDQQKQELLKGNCDVAVGTPNRVLKLIDVGALSFTRCSCVIVDSSKDVKTTTILDMRGVREDFFKLFHSHIVSNPKLRVCLY